MSTSSRPAPAWKTATIMGVSLALGIGLFSYCGWKEARQDVRAQQLEDRTREIGDDLVNRINQLDSRNPIEGSVRLRGEDVVDINTDPHRSWYYVAHAEFYAEDGMTAEDAATKTAEYLIDTGWEYTSRGIKPGSRVLSREDDLGDWTIHVDYSTYSAESTFTSLDLDVFGPRLSAK